MNFPKEMEEAARIDGSGFFGTFFKIVLPNARPAIGGALAIYTFFWVLGMISMAFDYYFTSGNVYINVRVEFFLKLHIILFGHI